jgi:SAM-dependent methyltransferase
MPPDEPPTTSATRACRICAHAENHRPFVAREMMFGTREEFEYFECANCGAVQISEVPADLSRYYPPDYLSFNRPPPRPNWLRRYLKRCRARQALGQPNLLGRLLSLGRPLPPLLEWAKNGGLRLDDAILDVGSGAGRLLLKMRAAGFSNLTGVDPFLQRDLRYDAHTRVLKLELAELNGPYDFVMLHHSLEHVPNPLSTLKEVRQLLKPDRFCLVRTPTAGGHAWRAYGADWVQLDPPRHLLLHTERSLRLLAGQAGLELAKTVFDSKGFQFWGSELYRRNIPLREALLPRDRLRKGLFTDRELAAFEAEAKRLNEQGQGDQASFYLRKPSEAGAI